MSDKTCGFCGGTFTDGVACYVLEQAAECNRAPEAKLELLRRRLTKPVPSPEPIAEQIVRLLDACDNRYSALRLVEPLVDACDARYEELRGKGFEKARRASRAEAVAALMERGGHLPATPVFLDDAP